MGKKLTSDELDYSYLIYPPAGAHKVFRIIKLYKVSRKSETIKTPELEIINKSLVDKQISAEEARMQIEFLRMELYQADGVEVVTPFVNLENRNLLNDYWEFAYAGRTLGDAAAAKYELERALSALGNLELKYAPQADLQRHLDKSLFGNKHRRVVVKLNSMLKFLQRGFVLKAAPKELTDLKFILLSDLPKLLEKLGDDEDAKLLHKVCFYTGATSGEALTLDQRSYDMGKDTIRIYRHQSTGGKTVQSGKSRITAVIPEGRDTLLTWFRRRRAFPVELKRRISLKTRKAALEAFPDSPIKHITFSDLRHSYAIHLLSGGIPLSLVAECLGIEPKSARELYGQFESSADALSLISKTLRGRQFA